MCLQRANVCVGGCSFSKWVIIAAGRSLAEGRSHRETPFPTWPPIADLVLHWSDLKRGLAVLHYHHPLRKHMINDVLFPHFCF